MTASKATRNRVSHRLVSNVKLFLLYQDHLNGNLRVSFPCLLLIAASNHQTVIDDVTSKFENQSVEELAEQKTKIQDMLDSGEASVDSEFWEAVLKELHVFQVSLATSLTRSDPRWCFFSSSALGGMWLLLEGWGAQYGPSIRNMVCLAFFGGGCGCKNLRPAGVLLKSCP